MYNIYLILPFRSCATLCDIQNSAVNCAERDLSEIPNEITANVVPEGVLKLDLSNNPIEAITKDSFKAFTKLEELVLANNGLSSIEDGAFDGLEHMSTLNLSNNRLSQFKSELLKQNPDLTFLILSNNQLESWDNFKLTDLPKLSYLDISKNRFTYLPPEILTILETNEKFTIVVDENPWDCENEILKNSKVAGVLCEHNGENKVTANVTNDVEVSTAGVIALNNDTIGYLNPSTESPVPNICIVKSYKRNLLPIWLALATVAGIIIGNFDRIYGWLKSKCSRNSMSKYIFLKHNALLA